MRETSPHFIGGRLKGARESLGLTLKEVAKKMGFPNYQTLSNIESNKREVKAWELARLARIYYRDISYFLSEHEGKPEEPVILWRKKTEGLQVKPYERRFLNYCNNYYSLEQMLRLHSPTKFRPIQCSRDDFVGYDFVEELAHKYYNMLSLGSRPAWCLSKILDERFAVKICFLEMGRQESGASTFGDFGPAILINGNDSPWRRNYDLAHEFFHLLIIWSVFQPEELHSEDQEKSRVEQFADVFASALLLPEIASILSRNEARYYFDSKEQRKSIHLLGLVQKGKVIEVLATVFQQKNLISKFDRAFAPRLDPGEIESLCILQKNSNLTFCTFDTAAIIAFGLLGMSHRGISLEKALIECGLNRKLEPKHSEKRFRRILKGDERRTLLTKFSNY